MNRLLKVVAVLVLVTACDAVGDPIPTVPAPSPLTGDWPGPLRVEPAGGAATVSMEEQLAVGAANRAFTDGIGDIGEGAPGWLDITTLDVAYPDPCCLVVGFNLADDLQAPIRGRVAYGLVADVDGDGTADVRFGIVNISDMEHVQWLTDLATGHTDHSDQFDNAIADTSFPSQHDRPVGGHIHVVMLEEYAEFRFYLWASQILGGQVVAKDYAPDQGWIDRPEADR